MLSAARLACALRIALGVSLLELLLGGASSAVDQLGGAAGVAAAAATTGVCCVSLLAGVGRGAALVAALTGVLPDAPACDEPFVEAP